MNRKWMPIAAGTLTIIGGLSFFVFIWFMMPFWPIIIYAIFAIIGGMYAWERRKWPLALAGSISAFITLFPIIISMFSSRNDWFWILALIGIAAIILTALSKKQFR